MNKHPCLDCEYFKTAKSGKTFNCKHPKITENDTYQYGRGFSCRCLPKWCPEHPNRDYLGEKVKAPEGERRKPHAQTTQDNTIPTKPIESDRVKFEMERVKNETENEMKNEQTLNNSITEQMQEKIAYASEQRKRLGSLVYSIDLSNRDKSLDRTDEMIATEDRISETLMNLLDVYDGIQ